MNKNIQKALLVALAILTAMLVALTREGVGG